MSLFQVKEKWFVDVGIEEEFHEGSLCVAQFESNEGIIIVGSLKGILRVFKPRQRDFRVEDQLLAADLKSPILQLEYAFFVRSSSKSLAVLHPSSLNLFSLQSTPDGMLCVPLYSQNLQRSAANMTFGIYGVRRGKSSIYVQSLDGELTFFEEDSVRSIQAFDDHLVAGPLLYVNGIQAFVTSTTAFEIVAYTFQSATDKKQTFKSGYSINSQATAQCLWKTVIGEQALSIQEGYIQLSAPNKGNQSVLVVLGERSLFYISTTGTLLSHKGFDFTSLTMITYPVPSAGPPPKQSKVIIISQTKQLMVLDGMKLLWSAKCANAPVALRLIEVDGVEGMIVTLDDRGHLSCSFLGTQPNSSLPFLGEESTVNADDLVSEYRTLKKQLQKERIRKEADEAPCPFEFHCEIQEEDKCLQAEHRGVTTNGSVFSLVFSATCKTTETLLDCDFLFVPPVPANVDEDSWTVPVIDPGKENEITIPLRFSLAPGVPSSDNRCKVFVSYKTHDHKLLTSTSSIEMPLYFFYRVVPPVKDAKFKFVLATNQQAVSLRDLFDDVLVHWDFKHALDANVLTFENFSDVKVTIIVSKASGKYRIQSDCFEATSFFISELRNRLHLHHIQNNPEEEASSLTTTVKEALPFEEYFRIIEEHFQARKDVIQIDKELDKLSQQYRATQKRLISKYKDSQPKNIECLHLLLQKTLNQVLSFTDKMETALSRLDSSGLRLSQSTDLLILLLQFRTSISLEDVKALKSILSPECSFDVKIGWEEHAEQTIGWALSSYFKDTTVGYVSTTQPTTLNNIDILKIGIKKLLQRIEEFGRLIPKPAVKEKPAKT